MIGFLLRLSIVRDKLEELLMLLIFCSVKPQNGTVFISYCNGGYLLLPLASFQEGFWPQNSG